MSCYGSFLSSGLWQFTCAGCGAEFEVEDYTQNPLDNLGCCSAECDQKVEADLQRRLDADPDFRAMVEEYGL